MRENIHTDLVQKNTMCFESFRLLMGLPVQGPGLESPAPTGI